MLNCTAAGQSIRTPPQGLDENRSPMNLTHQLVTSHRIGSTSNLLAISSIFFKNNFCFFKADFFFFFFFKFLLFVCFGVEYRSDLIELSRFMCKGRLAVSNFGAIVGHHFIQSSPTLRSNYRFLTWLSIYIIYFFLKSIIITGLISVSISRKCVIVQDILIDCSEAVEVFLNEINR